MADDIYVYLRPLPEGINELVMPCADGYTVYIADRLDQEHQMKAYEHALRHIANNDFDKSDVQEIEAAAHGIINPDQIIPEAKWKMEIEELKKQQKKLKAQIRQNQRRINFLQREGYDFMAAAEARYLEP